MQKTRLGTTELSVTPVCIGTGVLGNMPDSYTYEVDVERARSTVRAIFDGPINFLDTSRNYGFGRSEQRIGDVIRDRDMETGRSGNFHQTRSRHGNRPV